MEYLAKVYYGSELPERWKDFAFNEDHAFIVINYNDGSSEIYSEYMEPEDTRFCRDLAWIVPELHKAYKNGFEAGQKAKK